MSEPSAARSFSAVLGRLAPSLLLTFVAALVLAVPAALLAGPAAGSAEPAPAVAAPAADSGDEAVARGEVTYRVHCLNCHGESGRGDGPMADVLKVAPADLTLLAARAGGTFPAEEVRSAIDGRREITGHGRRQMPIWGLAFQERGRVADQEAEVGGRIADLVAFLASLQREESSVGGLADGPGGSRVAADRPALPPHRPLCARPTGWKSSHTATTEPLPPRVSLVSGSVPSMCSQRPAQPTARR